MFEENIIETEVSSNIVETESDSLIGTPGIDGVTFTPSVSQEGIISWTNNGGLSNPTPINIKGEKGEKGERGPKGDNGEKGDKGDKGEKGERGNVSSDTINSIVVVDSLPVIEEDGVLYLVKGPMEYVANPPMMMGYISTTDGTQCESTDHCISGYIYIYEKEELTITNSAGLSMRIFCYDENKNFVTDWTHDSNGTPCSYEDLASGETQAFYYGYYVRIMISSTEVVSLNISYDVAPI